MSDGFARRWSQRKLEAKRGRAVEPEPPPPTQADALGARAAETAASATDGAVARDQPPEASVDQKPAKLPPLTLDDVKALTAESDYSRFVASDVAAEVKNAAMKKLFADPRYSVMDGLDVYTGDFSKPQPIPDAMLRQLATAAFLGLFDQAQAPQEAAGQPRDVADNPTDQTVAKSSTAPQAAAAEPAEHADPDLRLQQDHAAPGKDPGRGTG